ncbi:hypothetical protein N866_04485 [Actinotalea ferrariae CF5-4]|uniref:Uncharacterized protein n=1 Tax=Actinotalea ferrariae CF5-4 TaxID=948458 RepID=A0A021VS95_9CELL|nr:hypothetical protein N866_04485 [Actinotalea ferrariae CF5-4]
MRYRPRVVQRPPGRRRRRDVRDAREASLLRSSPGGRGSGDRRPAPRRPPSSGALPGPPRSGHRSPDPLTVSPWVPARGLPGPRVVSCQPLTRAAQPLTGAGKGVSRG